MEKTMEKIPVAGEEPIPRQPCLNSFTKEW
jgi:hypothetical protein